MTTKSKSSTTPKLSEIAKIIYDQAIKGARPEEEQKFWPLWEDLPESRAKDSAYKTANSVLGYLIIIQTK
jgi:hypothetical protein